LALSGKDWLIMNNILKSIAFSLWQVVSRFLSEEWIDGIFETRLSDEEMELINSDNNTPSTMFADYPDIVGTNEVARMFGISKNLACKLLREEIESFLIGREFKSTKEDVINYIINKKKLGGY
jgi:hypothetical protein